MIERLPFPCLENVFHFLYDKEHEDSYRHFTRDLGSLNSHLLDFCRTREFLEEYYWLTFESEAIPYKCDHTFSTYITETCKIDGEVNIGSEITPRGWNKLTWKRCTNRHHYGVPERGKKTKFKNLYRRCVKRYVSITKRRNRVTELAQDWAFLRKRRAQDRYEKAKENMERAQIEFNNAISTLNQGKRYKHAEAIEKLLL